MCDGAPKCLLYMLDKLQKRAFRTADPGRTAAFPEPLAHRQNETSFSIGITLADAHPTDLVAIPYSRPYSRPPFTQDL